MKESKERKLERLGTPPGYRLMYRRLRAVELARLATRTAIARNCRGQMRATGGIRLAASGPVLVQQPAAAGRVRASWQRRAYACGCACCLRKRTPSSMELTKAW